MSTNPPSGDTMVSPVSESDPIERRQDAESAARRPRRPGPSRSTRRCRSSAPRGTRRATAEPSSTTRSRRPSSRPRGCRCATAASPPCSTSRCASPSKQITAFIGPVGLRQVDDPALLRPHERPDPGGEGRRHGALPRARPLRPGHRRGAGAQAHRDGLPEAQPVPEVDLRQHRLRPQGPGYEGRHGRDRRERRCGARRCGTTSRTASRTTRSGCPAASSSASASRARSPRTPTCC